MKPAERRSGWATLAITSSWASVGIPRAVLVMVIGIGSSVAG